jgi:maltooligosyltrehalose trehalohydrolase
MSDTFPQVGALWSNGLCTFCVWAPLKKTVDVLVEGRAYSMTCDERGYWKTTMDDIPTGTHYKFRLDNKDVLPDPASNLQPEGVHGHSAVVDHTFPWTDAAWSGLELKDMIIYELHVGTFTQEGTFESIISKLDYLRTLGVNAIEIMPVAQFPGDRNWGYDGVYPFAPQHSYGGVAGFKKLVNACHENGIAVVLDVVYNHQGPEGNYLGMYAPYFTDKYKTGWGQAINFDDAYSDGVRNFYWQNALMWLKEYHIDALRLDAVHAIWDSGAKHFIAELSNLVRPLEKETGRKKVLIAEFDLNNPRYISSPKTGGYGLDGQWIDEYHHALHSVVTGEVDGYYEDFGTIDHLAKSIRDSYVYTGQYSKHRKKNFGTACSGNHYGQFIAFAQNHDQIGNRMKGDRLSHQLSFEKLKLTAAAYLLSPHVPMLFMGEEYGERNPFQYFISHTDAELVEAIRKGRKEEFAYFRWDGDIPDPQDEKTFLACKLSWHHESDATSATLLLFYRHLIAFRKEQAAMKNVDRSSVSVWPAEDKLIAFERRSESQTLLVVLNFSAGTSELPLKEKLKFRVLIDSASKTWFGAEQVVTNEVFTHDFLAVSPESVKVIEILD